MTPPGTILFREAESASSPPAGRRDHPPGQSNADAAVHGVEERHLSCFNTPFSTNTFVFLDEDPGLLKESQKNEPGFLITDLYGLLGFKKLCLSAPDVCALLRECVKYGINPVAVSELNQKAGKKKPDEIKKSFSG